MGKWKDESVWPTMRIEPLPVDVQHMSLIGQISYDDKFILPLTPNGAYAAGAYLKEVIGSLPM